VEEMIQVPRRLVLELCQMAMPFNKKHVLEIAQLISAGSVDALLPSRQACPLSDDKKHNYASQGCNDEHVGWNKKVWVARTRLCCVNCGYVQDLMSQPFTSENATALRDYTL
jgi:hypothetical protein